MYHLTLNATFHTSVTHLFDAFHRPELLIQWFAPGSAQVSQIMANFTEGGRYRITMQEPNGDKYTLTGIYSYIRRNEKIVMSWAWEDDREESVITTVEVELESVDDATTALTLIHSGFANEQERNQHQQGWMACFEKLSGVQY
ncbi:SRPBCC domain-containing protein [Alteromonas sp. ASW11-19]|uniref:SRPBCC domain-containing protein n=1 Tax=Alteromonas salexigens TaxID=2982530 RepID=A0ABT2VQ58_9ALTE|nr:SRPBCC domain-containing protein [Alteromonas salexigens]MCU7555445.1 SRPBCC domain-containing protein [Alteromonas salexigens]